MRLRIFRPIQLVGCAAEDDQGGLQLNDRRYGALPPGYTFPVVIHVDGCAAQLQDGRELPMLALRDFLHRIKPLRCMRVAEKDDVRC